MFTHTRLWRPEAELKTPEIIIVTRAEDEALELFRFGDPDLTYVQVQVKDDDEGFSDAGLSDPFYNLAGELCQCIEVDRHGVGVVPSPIPDRCEVELDGVTVKLLVLIR